MADSLPFYYRLVTCLLTIHLHPFYNDNFFWVPGSYKRWRSVGYACKSGYSIWSDAKEMFS